MLRLERSLLGHEQNHGRTFRLILQPLPDLIQQMRRLAAPRASDYEMQSQCISPAFPYN
ncbi:hypothetical protein J6TS7_33790 [Paenibacillus dendritiformis]|nr:hypothetical protein J6TS7_33790 [Paenibacillus dendritiformis]